MMTTMRFRDIAAHGRDEHERELDSNRRLSRIVLAQRRLPALRTAAVANDVRSIRARPTTPQTATIASSPPATTRRWGDALTRVRALGRMRPRGREGH